MYFLSQPETKCPATESIENLLVAMTTTNTSGTSAPSKLFVTMHYDHMTSTSYISSMVLFFI